MRFTVYDIGLGGQMIRDGGILIPVEEAVRLLNEFEDKHHQLNEQYGDALNELSCLIDDNEKLKRENRRLKETIELLLGNTKTDYDKFWEKKIKKHTEIKNYVSKEELEARYEEI